ncbi:MAG: transcription termination factor Rho, partial [Armatimonadota bacterium]|nr:transcription termination factor Rho [Armatimonadota bacterium]
MSEKPLQCEGILEILPSGVGYVRQRADFAPSPSDAYVSPAQIRAFNLRTGDHVMGETRPPRGKERAPALVSLLRVEGEPPDNNAPRPAFETLTALSPCERIRLESAPDDFTGRAIDLLAPLGKGQRGLIVAPPKAGKTQILQRIARSIARNSPEIHLL